MHQSETLYFFAYWAKTATDTKIFCVEANPLRLPRRNFLFKEPLMETRVALVGIIVEDVNAAEHINALLHEYGPYIIGRMGIPYRQRGINIISVAMDAPQDVISALSGKIGKLTGVSVKTAYSNVVTYVDN